MTFRGENPPYSGRSRLTRSLTLKIKMLRQFALLAALISPLCLQGAELSTAPAQSESFLTTGGLFLMHVGGHGACYGMTFALQKHLWSMHYAT